MRDLNIPDSTMLLTLGERLPRAESQALHSKRLKYCQGTDEERAAALRGVFSFGGELYCFPAEVEADPEMGGAARDAWAVERDRIKQGIAATPGSCPSLWSALDFTGGCADQLLGDMFLEQRQYSSSAGLVTEFRYQRLL